MTNLKNSSNYQTFLDKRNIFGLANKSKLWETEEEINNYLDYVAKKFPLTAIPKKLEELKNKNQDKLKQAIKDFDRESIKLILISILKDSDVADLLKTEAQKQVDELFKKDASLNFNQVDERTIRRFKGKIRRGPEYGTDEIMFLTYFLGEEVFLNHIPAELQKELEKNPRTNFSRIDQNKWNDHRNNLLFKIFDNFPSTLTKEEDLAEIEKAINEVYPQFLELIKEAKQSQNGKPDELTGQTGGSGGGNSQNLAELEQAIQNALTTNPQTGTNWDPILTEEEKEIIKNPNLDTKGAIQAAAKLLSHLRDIRNDEKNGGPNGKLADWDTVEKVNKAIQAFQKTHHVNIYPYQKAQQNTDHRKAWEAVNSKLNEVAKNICQRYWELIFSEHQKLEELDKSTTQISLRWNKAEIIDLRKEGDVLGAKWREDLAKKVTPEEIVTERDRLIQKIADTEKEEKKKQEEYEKEIQVKIDNAQRFIRRALALSADKSNELLKELKDFRRDYGFSSVPAKYHAFLNKNNDNAFDKLIANLRLKIGKDRAVESINRELRDLNEAKEENRCPLQTFDLGRKYYNFVSDIYKMEDEGKVNEYENEMIILINKVRLFRVDLDKSLKTVKRLLDKDDNSQEAQKSREKVWDFLLDLEKYKNSSESDNRYMWLTYGRKWDAVDPLIDELLSLIRNQDSTLVTKWKNILISVAEKEKNFIEKEFTAYQRGIRRADSLSLKNQSHEKTFQEKIENHLKQQLQNRSQEEQEAKIQQQNPSVFPKK